MQGELTGQGKGFGDRAFAVSHMLFRLLPTMQDRRYAESLEEHALRLLSEANHADHEATLRSLTLLHYLVRLAPEVRAMSIRSSEVLCGEIVRFWEDLAQHQAAREETLEALLSPVVEPLLNQNEILSDLSSGKVNGNGGTNGNEGINGSSSGNANGKVNGNQKPFGNEDRRARQERILARIRQAENCRLKDLQDSLSDVSERTLRYDLQDLLEKGKLERIGGGGPFSYYQLPSGETALTKPKEAA